MEVLLSGQRRFRAADDLTQDVFLRAARSRVPTDDSELLFGGSDRPPVLMVRSKGHWVPVRMLTYPNVGYVGPAK